MKFYLFPLSLLVSFAVGFPAFARNPVLPEIPCNEELVGDILASDLESNLERLASLDGVKKALTRLNKVPRAGWVRRGIPEELMEHVLDHSKKVFQAALLFPKRDGLNRKKMALMAYFHDIAEYEVPDYTPQDGVSPEQKFRDERAAIRKMIRKTPEQGKVIMDLWEEYAAKKTPEAQIVGQLDKLDAAIQSFEYLKLGFNVSDFVPYTESKLTDPVLLEVLQQLKTSYRDGNTYDSYFDFLKSKHSPKTI